LNKFENGPHRRLVMVSYLAVAGPAYSIDRVEACAIRGEIDLSRCLSPQDGDDAAGKAAAAVEPVSGVASRVIVRASLIDKTAGNAPLVRKLLDLLHIQLRCLAHSVTVRGAVVMDLLHVGPGLEGPYYGPALSRARELEANQADLPRIAVGEEVVRRLGSGQPARVRDGVLRSEMDVIDTLMTMDDAGLHYLDYLKAGLGDFDYDFDRYTDFLSRHKLFVESGLADASPGHDPGAYRWLRRYHNARIDDDISPADRDTQDDECGRLMQGVLAPLRIG